MHGIFIRVHEALNIRPCLFLHSGVCSVSAVPKVVVTTLTYLETVCCWAIRTRVAPYGQNYNSSSFPEEQWFDQAERGLVMQTNAPFLFLPTTSVSTFVSMIIRYCFTSVEPGNHGYESIVA